MARRSFTGEGSRMGPRLRSLPRSFPASPSFVVVPRSPPGKQSPPGNVKTAAGRRSWLSDRFWQRYNLRTRNKTTPNPRNPGETGSEKPVLLRAVNRPARGVNVTACDGNSPGVERQTAARLLGSPSTPPSSSEGAIAARVACSAARPRGTASGPDVPTRTACLVFQSICSTHASPLSGLFLIGAETCARH